MQVPSVLQPTLAELEVPWGPRRKALLGGSTTLALSDSVSVTLTFRPLALSVAVAEKPAIHFNSEHMFAFEHLREKKVLSLR